MFNINTFINGNLREEGLPILKFPATARDIVGDFSESLREELVGVGWTRSQNFLKQEALVHLLNRLNLPGELFTIEDVEKLLSGETVEKLPGWKFNIEDFGFRQEKREAPDIYLLVQLRDPDNKSIILENDGMLTTLSKGDTLTIIWQTCDEGAKTLPLFTLKGFRSALNDSWLDADNWIPCFYFREMAIEGAEIHWAKQFPDRESIEIDYDSLSPDPNKECAFFSHYATGTVHTQLELTEKGLVCAYYKFIEA